MLLLPSINEEISLRNSTPLTTHLKFLPQHHVQAVKGHHYENPQPLPLSDLTFPRKKLNYPQISHSLFL